MELEPDEAAAAMEEEILVPRVVGTLREAATDCLIAVTWSAVGKAIRCYKYLSYFVYKSWYKYARILSFVYLFWVISFYGRGGRR